MKIALVTGGTSGVGLSIVKALLKQKYKVYFIGRNSEKGKSVEADLDVQYPKLAKFIQLDLSNIKGVKAFAKEFIKEQDRLDVLANVAGVMLPKQQITEEGFDKTFSIGYLSAYVLSIELVPLLEKAPYGRIVNVAGVKSLILKAKLNFEDINFSNKYNSFRTGITTVHAKTVLTEILAEKYRSKGIDVNSFDPGAVRSDLMNGMSLIGRSIFKFISLFMAKESKTGIYVSSSPDIQGVTGVYFQNKKQTEFNFDTDYKDKLWKISEELLSSV